MCIHNLKFIVSCHLSECPSGTYGPNCNQNCSKHCVNSICDKFSETAVCLNGCQPGYTRENCTEGKYSPSEYKWDGYKYALHISNKME